MSDLKERVDMCVCTLCGLVVKPWKTTVSFGHKSLKQIFVYELVMTGRK